MRTALSIVLLVAATVLLVYGIRASDSLASSFTSLFQGTPTDHSITLILAGAACAALGLFGLRRGEPRLA